MNRSWTYRSTAWKVLVLALTSPGVASAEDRQHPNVLFISVDDLNDWTGCLGGHPQAMTPNIDRLAASGVLFTNAHCAAPACNPSRTAIMTGISPHVSGLYENGQKMREILPDAVLLPKYFANHGYWAAGSGKLLHYFIDAQSWHEYFPAKETEDPFPRTLYPKQRPVSLPRGGPWQYIETDWAPLDATDEEFGGDKSDSIADNTLVVFQSDNGGPSGQNNIQLDANAGITYVSDDGAPQLSWVAHIENKGTAHNTARADADLEFLGLELRGNAASGATQSLVLGPGVNLIGRNEIRLASGGVLAVDGGTVSTLRRVDIQPAASLKGAGSIDGIVYNNGQVVVSGSRQPRLGITSDYHQSVDGALDLFLTGEGEPFLSVADDAHLDGELIVTTGKDFNPHPANPTPC
jgi:hypothetical protein